MSQYSRFSTFWWWRGLFLCRDFGYGYWRNVWRWLGNVFTRTRRYLQKWMSLMKRNDDAKQFRTKACHCPQCGRFVAQAGSYSVYCKACMDQMVVEYEADERARGAIS